MIAFVPFISISILLVPLGHSILFVIGMVLLIFFVIGNIGAMIFPITIMSALADEAATDSVDEGDIGIPRMTLDRKLLIEIADATTDSQRLAITAAGSAAANAAAHVRDF